MFQDEPTDVSDAIRWHQGLMEFYRRNLLRPCVGEDPVLCEGHRSELDAHSERLQELQDMAAGRAPASVTASAAAREQGRVGTG